MPTRELRVQFLGDERDLQRAMRSSGRSIGPLERRMGTFGKAGDTAFSRIGSAARRATPYITGGLVVGLGLAVREGIEAQKTTAQTAAAIHSTGGAAKVSATHLADYANHLSLISGVDDEVIQSGGNLLLTFTQIRNEAGKGNKIFDRTLAVANDMSAALGQDMKASAIQLGKALNDPTTGLTALRRVGVSFSEQQTERIQKWYEEGQVVRAQKAILAELTKEFGGSAAAQATGLDKLKVAVANVGESIGLQVLPELERVGNRASEILSAKNLTGDQKAEQMIDLFGDELERGIDTLTDLAPKVAAVGAKLGLKVAEGFVKAFINSDPLGQLFIAGLAFKTLGGPGVFGKALGSKMGRGFGLAFLAAVLSLDLANEIAKAIHGEKLGTTASEEFATEINQAFAPILGSVNAQIGKRGVTLTTALGNLIFNPETGKVIAAKGRRLQGFIGKSVGQAVTGLSALTGPKFWLAARADIGGGLDMIAATYRGKLGKLAGITRTELAAVRRTMHDSPEAGRQAFIGVLDKMIANIAAAMRRGQIATTRGMDLIAQLLARRLEAVGAVVGPNFPKLKPVPGATLGGKPIGGQHGATIVPGSGSGDKVPLHLAGQLAALVEPGELVSVANRTATAAIMAVNGSVKRRKGGGTVPMFRGVSPGVIDDLAAGNVNILALAANRALRRSGSGFAGGRGMRGVINEANRMNALHQPYLWGGGHGASASRMGPWDCSGAVSELIAGSVDPNFTPVVSGGFTSMFRPGRGAFSILANAGHVYAVLNGRAFGTSAENPGGGAGWISGYTYRPGFVTRHVPIDGSPVGRKRGRRGRGDAPKPGMKLGGVIRAAGGAVVGASMYGGPSDSSVHGDSGAYGHLSGTMGFAELGMGHALGGWPPHALAKISYRGRSVIGEKLDIGAGGGDVAGHPRAIDLWYQTANALGFHGLGLVKVKRVSRSFKPGRGGAGGGAARGGAPSAPPIPMRLLGRQHRELLGPASAAASGGVRSARRAMAEARGTATASDDIAALQQLRTARASEKELDKARKRWQWAKRHGTKAQKRAALENLIGVEQGLTPRAAETDTSGAEDLQQQIADHLAEVAEELKALRESINEQNAIAKTELAIGLAEARKAFADVLSGELGGRVTARGHTAGVGSVVRA